MQGPSQGPQPSTQGPRSGGAAYDDCRCAVSSSRPDHGARRVTSCPLKASEGMHLSNIDTTSRRVHFLQTPPTQHAHVVHATRTRSAQYLHCEASTSALSKQVDSPREASLVVRARRHGGAYRRCTWCLRLRALVRLLLRRRDPQILHALHLAAHASRSVIAVVKFNVRCNTSWARQTQGRMR